MSRDDNLTDYFEFSPYLVFNGIEFGLIIIEFLACFDLFSQIRDKFGMSSDIVTPVPHRIYFKNFFLLFYFIL